MRELHVRYGNIIEYSFDFKEEILNIQKKEILLRNMQKDLDESPDNIKEIDMRILENELLKMKTMAVMSKNEFIKLRVFQLRLCLKLRICRVVL